MAKNKTGGRGLKYIILEILKKKDFDKGLREISRLPARQAVNPLFSFFYHSDDLIKWRAITAMGVLVSELAETNMESARVIVRRLLWNLNDESGGIGWGSPEALGEIMARHPKLAEEYSDILISYIRKEQNYIEYEALQRGVLWGLGRLAQERPQRLKEVPPLLLPYLESKDATLRGLAAWTTGLLGSDLTIKSLQKLCDDHQVIKLFLDGQLIEKTVGHLAREALARIGY
jgi:HEAT repeat protein